MPTRRRSGSTLPPTPSTSTPSMTTRPRSGRVMPATMRRSVDLPEPDGPRMQRISPALTSRETSSSAVVPPNATVIPSIISDAGALSTIASSARGDATASDGRTPTASAILRPDLTIVAIESRRCLSWPVRLEVVGLCGAAGLPGRKQMTRRNAGHRAKRRRKRQRSRPASKTPRTVGAGLGETPWRVPRRDRVERCARHPEDDPARTNAKARRFAAGGASFYPRNESPTTQTTPVTNRLDVDAIVANGNALRRDLSNSRAKTAIPTCPSGGARSAVATYKSLPP